jgi:hypothetical protein
MGPPFKQFAALGMRKFLTALEGVGSLRRSEPATPPLVIRHVIL